MSWTTPLLPPNLAHVDIRRDYNPQTGEESNVIIENQFDRLWHERDYMRVDWGNNQVSNFDFIAPTRSVVNAGYFEEEEQLSEGALYTERNAEGNLNYFDVLGKLFVEPTSKAASTPIGDLLPKTAPLEKLQFGHHFQRHLLNLSTRHFTTLTN